MSAMQSPKRQDRSELVSNAAAKLEKLPDGDLKRISNEIDTATEREAFWAEVLESIPREWHQDFKSMVGSGAASVEFIKHWEENPEGPVAKAIDKVFQRQATALESFAENLAALKNNERKGFIERVKEFFAGHPRI